MPCPPSSEGGSFFIACRPHPIGSAFWSSKSPSMHLRRSVCVFPSGVSFDFSWHFVQHCLTSSANERCKRVDSLQEFANVPGESSPKIRSFATSSLFRIVSVAKPYPCEYSRGGLGSFQKWKCLVPITFGCLTSLPIKSCPPDCQCPKT